METRCPVPLQGPRSPLGYQVIEIEDEQVPPSRACPQASREQAEWKTPTPTRAPWAAVGCQVVEVGEEWSPGVPPSPEPAVPAPKRRPVRQVPPLLIWGALVAGVFFLPALALGLLIVHLPTGSRTIPPDRTLAQKSGRTTAIANAPQEAVAGGAGLGGSMAAEGGMPGPVAGLPGSGCQPRGHYLIQLPESDPAQALDKDQTEALPPVAKEACQAGQAERETFGTAVQFVRNPQEAARIAGAERKLTFLLHVSGNFEDDRFTWNNAEALRVNALTNGQVGRYLNRHFVSAFQKVATFQIVGPQKQGGNVAGYFCTPCGRVLHAVAGPVNAAVFLREARWANETYQLAQLENQDPARLQAFFRQAHLERLQREHNAVLPQERLPRPDTVSRKLLEQVFVLNQQMPLENQGKVHLLLTVAPTPPLGQVYHVVFDKILNEKVSTEPVKVAGR